jgi:hypothetical protein
VREQQNLYHATEILNEDKASGTQLIQELIADGCHGVTRYQLDCENIMRLHAQTAMIENGFVSIPQNATGFTEYLYEMTVFPNGKHDDQVDSTVQFLDWFKTSMPYSGLFKYYRREAKAAEQRRQPRPAHTVPQPGSMQWLEEQKTQMNRRSGTFYPESIISIGFGEICRAAKPGASSSETLSCPINST